VTGSYPDAPASMRRPPRATHGSSARPGADARADAKPGHSSRRKGLTPAHPYLCRARPRAACAARPRSNKTPSTMSAPFKADGRLLLRANEISSTPRMAIHTLGEPHPPHLILIWQGPPLLPYALSRPGLTARRISPLNALHRPFAVLQPVADAGAAGVFEVDGAPGQRPELARPQTREGGGQVDGCVSSVGRVFLELLVPRRGGRT
jgi:hypothetical protein